MTSRALVLAVSAGGTGGGAGDGEGLGSGLGLGDSDGLGDGEAEGDAPAFGVPTPCRSGRNVAINTTARASTTRAATPTRPRVELISPRELNSSRGELTPVRARDSR